MIYVYLLYSTNPSRFKIGVGWHLYRRVNTVDRTTKGKQGVIIAVLLPFFARQVEAALHRRYARHHAPLRYGSGRSEYFRRGLWVVECVFIMLLVALVQWLFLIGCAGVALKILLWL